MEKNKCESKDLKKAFDGKIESCYEINDMTKLFELSLVNLLEVTEIPTPILIFKKENGFSQDFTADLYFNYDSDRKKLKKCKRVSTRKNQNYIVQHFNCIKPIKGPYTANVFVNLHDENDKGKLSFCEYFKN